MSLLERCKTLRTQLIRRDALLREVKSAEGFSARNHEIAELHKALMASIGQLEILRKHGIPVARVPDCTAARQRLISYGESLESDSPNSGREHGAVKKILTAICNRFEEAARDAIDVVHSLPTVDQRFLKDVDASGADKKIVAEMRLLREELQRISNKAFTAESLAVFLNKRTALQALTERLNPDDFPKEVLEFFKAAQQGAPLDKLTMTVRDWLAARGRLDNIRIYIMEQ